ncbi:hypothetical protein [Paenibacillus kobensis]|uniref:hypothetical protein n=1 Tax=Paenibacillus kobensis TaxID=59841 RepID=UPI000FDAF521|nr:hypothetical protein [Paenibacillus kobensis]
MTEPINGLAQSFYRLAGKPNDGSWSGTTADDTLRLHNANLNKKRTTNAPKGQVLADMKEA